MVLVLLLAVLHKFCEKLTLLIASRPKFRLPVRMVVFIVVLLDWMLEQLKKHESAYPRLGRAMVYLLSRTKTFNCSNAQKHIGYSPVVSLEVSRFIFFNSFPLSFLSFVSSHLLCFGVQYFCL